MLVLVLRQSEMFWLCFMHLLITDVDYILLLVACLDLVASLGLLLWIGFGSLFKLGIEVAHFDLLVVGAQLFQKFVHAFLGEAFLSQIDVARLLLPIDEVFLGMRPYLQRGPGSNALLHAPPVFAVELNGIDELIVLFFRPPSQSGLLLASFP